MGRPAAILKQARAYAEIAKISPNKIYRQKAVAKLYEMMKKSYKEGLRELKGAPSNFPEPIEIIRLMEDITLFGNYYFTKETVMNLFPPNEAGIESLRRIQVDSGALISEVLKRKEQLWSDFHLMREVSLLDKLTNDERSTKIKELSLTEKKIQSIKKKIEEKSYFREYEREKHQKIEDIEKDIYPDIFLIDKMMLEDRRTARHSNNYTFRSMAIVFMKKYRKDIEGLATTVMRAEYDDSREKALDNLLDILKEREDAYKRNPDEVNLKLIEEVRYWLRYSLVRTMSQIYIPHIYPKSTDMSDIYKLTGDKELVTAIAMYSKVESNRDNAVYLLYKDEVCLRKILSGSTSSSMTYTALNFLTHINEPDKQKYEENEYPLAIEELKFSTLENTIKMLKQRLNTLKSIKRPSYIISEFIAGQVNRIENIIKEANKQKITRLLNNYNEYLKTEHNKLISNLFQEED